MADPKQLASLLSEEEELRRFNAAQGDQPWYSKALPMEGRATFLPFRDTMEGSVFNKRELALPGILAGALNAFTSPARALTGSDPTFKPGEEAANMALNTFGGGIATGKAMTNPTGLGGKDLALNVYHGTPHEIKGKFDISKVGTGEGAQSYGHGMYFAENPKVAESYQTMRAEVNPEILKYKNQDIQTLYNKAERAQELAYRMPNGPAKNAAIEKANAELSIWEDVMLGNHPQVMKMKAANPATDDVWAVKQDLIKQLDLNSFKGLNSNIGNLYKADIPDAALPMMLDWDKPLNQQSGAVKEALSKIGVTVDEKAYKSYLDDLEAQLLGSESKNTKYVSVPSGQEIYHKLVNKYGSPEIASQELNKLGITGIRYLDEGSRATGKGTSNFVVFKPEMVELLEKNSVPITRKELLQQEFDKLEK